VIGRPPKTDDGFWFIHSSFVWRSILTRVSDGKLRAPLQLQIPRLPTFPVGVIARHSPEWLFGNGLHFRRLYWKISPQLRLAGGGKWIRTFADYIARFLCS
jgi:hypothetical protein